MGQGNLWAIGVSLGLACGACSPPGGLDERATTQAQSETTGSLQPQFDFGDLLPTLVEIGEPLPSTLQTLQFRKADSGSLDIDRAHVRIEHGSSAVDETWYNRQELAQGTQKLIGRLRPGPAKVTITIKATAGDTLAQTSESIMIKAGEIVPLAVQLVLPNRQDLDQSRTAIVDLTAKPSTTGNTPSNVQTSAPAAGSLRLAIVAQQASPLGGTLAVTKTLDTDIVIRVTNTTGPISSYRFDFGDDTAPVTLSVPNARHQYRKAGNFRIQAWLLGARDTPGTGGTHILGPLVPIVAPPPTILVTSSTNGSQPVLRRGDGGYFTQSGDGFPPYTPVTLVFSYPDGRTPVRLSKTTDSQGRFTNVWSPANGAPTGVYQWYVAYRSGGRDLQSHASSYRIDP